MNYSYLHYVIVFPHRSPELVSYLCQAGFSTRDQNSQGETPLHVAAKKVITCSPSSSCPSHNQLIRNTNQNQIDNCSFQCLE